MLRARFMATVSLGFSTMMGGSGLLRLVELTPAAAEWAPGGEEPAVVERRRECDLRRCSETSSSSSARRGELACSFAWSS